MRMNLLLLTIAMLLVVGPAAALVGDANGNFSVTFEDQPIGSLNVPGFAGNGGWYVVADSPLNGTKAIIPGGAYDLMCDYDGVTFMDGTVASIDTRIDSTIPGSYFSWNIMGLYQPFVGLCWYDNQLLVAENGYSWAFTGNSLGTMYKDHNYHLTATLDFTNQRVAYGVKDLTAPGTSFSFNWAFGMPSTAAEASQGGIYVSGPGCMFDNFAVNTVPEPSALAALATGMIGVLGFIRRRK